MSEFIDFITQEHIEKLNSLNSILEEIMLIEEKLKKHGLKLEIIEINPKSRFQEKMNKIIKSKENAKI
jgi:hypothetical protein